MASAIPSYAGRCRAVICAVAGLANLTDQICLHMLSETP